MRQACSVISPIALEAVKRIDAIFAVERDINGLCAASRLAVRQDRSRPLVGTLEAWMREQRVKLSRHDPVAKALDYMLTRWPAFTCFLDDGRVCLSNNAAERALRGLALGRKSWLFCGSDRGGHRAAQIYSLIVTCKLNDVDPQAWLADALARIANHPLPAWTISCLGTGRRSANPPHRPLKPNASLLRRGTHRMRTACFAGEVVAVLDGAR